MATSKTQRKKQKRKAKKKQMKSAKMKQTIREKGLFYLYEAQYYLDTGNLKLALKYVKLAAKLLPDDEQVFRLMGAIAMEMNNAGLELLAINGMERIDLLDDQMKVDRVFLLLESGRLKEARKKGMELLKNFTALKIKNKRSTKKNLIQVLEYAKYALFNDNAGEKTPPQHSRPDPAQKKKKASPKKKAVPVPIAVTPAIQDVPNRYIVEKTPFLEALSNPQPDITPEAYELSLLSHEIRFTESFDTLICLPSLTQIKSFWYQEETAKKILKQFRGRALLSDEVGLGKTIEALMVLSEYLKRGMVKSALILTPTPLVSQWKQEAQSKFNLTIPSTDDPVFRSASKSFWELPLVIASINQAKSKKNYDLITGREYDLIIVDEAHHLKNRSTLNWKLVNALKKRFILLLTATPVENNLMELYNLITLLKPGQLETATAFREKFMKRGDPTDPRNRSHLKELLGQVMIRNTRALAGINIPPRFAETIRIEPTTAEKGFYQRLETLIISLNDKKQGRAKMMIKNLLAQAGSSPKAVELALNGMLEKNDYLLAHETEIRAVKNLCRTTLDTPKNKALLKLLHASREKIIVFVKYKGTIEHLAEFLEWNGISYCLFHGAMDNTEKNRSIEMFRNEHQVLVTTQIGGEGRNLQFCSRMVNYDLPWNPMKIEQRIGRIHRIGQKKEVHIFNFCATGSIEDYILDILDRKINMFEMVIGEIDMILGRVRGEKEFSDMIYDIWMSPGTDQDREKSFSNLGTKMKRAKTGYHKTRELDDKLFGDSYEL